MEILNLEEKTSNKTLYSDTGIKIQPGEIYFEGEVHGRTGRFTDVETEKLLGLRDVSGEERKSLAKEGKALKSGAFPMKNCSDVANAIHAIGRAKPSERSQVRSLIRKRVKELGCTGSVFENWK